MSFYRAYFVPNHLDPWGRMVRVDDTDLQHDPFDRRTPFPPGLEARLRAALMECCNKVPTCFIAPPYTPSCEEEVDSAIRGLKNARRSIQRRGGPGWGIPCRHVVNCAGCESTVAQGMFGTNTYFRYEGVRNYGLITHAWGQLRCKFDGGIIGTIDMFKDIDDFFRGGRDGFGWPGENHGTLERDWATYCDSSTGTVTPEPGTLNPTPYTPPPIEYLEPNQWPTLNPPSL